MRRTEPDLVTLRELADELAGEPSTARTWAKVVQRQAEDTPTPRLALRPTRHRERLAIAAAAATVVALAVTVTLTLRPGPDPATEVGAVPATAKPSPPATKTDPWTTPDPGSSPAPSLTGSVKTSPVSLSKAIDAMTRATKRAPSLTVKPGQFLYIRVDAFDREDGTWVPRTQDWWTDLHAVKKPSLDQPSAKYLASLPTDPAKLYDRFAAVNAGVKLGGEHYVTKEVFSALKQYGPLLKPEVRAAFFKVLGLVQGESAVTVKLDGHTYYGFRDLAPAQGDFYLLCDPSTGQIVGEAYDTNLVELWHVAVVDADGETG